MKKKLASLALAMAMVLTLAVPAFASTVSGGSVVSGDQMTTTLAGQYKAYTLKLTVKDGGKVLVNPYKIKFTPPGKDDPVDNQVVNVGTFITNSTDVALKVSAKITPTLGAGVSLLDNVNKVNQAGASVKSGDEVLETYVPKAAFMVFQIMKSSDNETEPSWTKPEAVVDGNAGAKVLTGDGTEAIEFADCITMDAVEEGGDPNYVCFHMDGLLNVYPFKEVGQKAVEDKWTENDTIGAGVILTFKPDVKVETYSGS